MPSAWLMVGILSNHIKLCFIILGVKSSSQKKSCSNPTEALELRAYSTQAPPSWHRHWASVGRVLCLAHAVSFWGSQHTCLMQHRCMKCSLYPKNSPGTQGPQITKQAHFERPTGSKDSDSRLGGHAYSG